MADDKPASHTGTSAEVSEDLIALDFTNQYRDTLRYDHSAGCWYEWDGSRWVRDDTARAYHYARQLSRRLGEGKRIHAKASVAGGAERFARADPAHAVTAERWDCDQMLLGTPGGTVDLRTGETRSARRDDFITKQTGATPIEGMPTLWLQFLSEALGWDQEMIDFVQRWLGYCLTGATVEHALVFIHGPGGCGKTTFLNAIVAILADYALTAPMSTFTKSAFDSHPTELAMLHGARLVTASETEEGRSWAESRLKELTGGDRITARFMRRDFFSYRPQFKLMIAGNYAPSLQNVDEAMRRRLNVLPFVVPPSNPDRQLEAKLIAEHGEILQWIIEGCLEWQRIGLARPQSIKFATDEYFAEQDVFSHWILERCVIDPNTWELPMALFNSWCAYAKEIGETAGTIKDMKARLERRGFRYGRSSGIRQYRGLVLRRSDRSDAW